MTVSSSNVRRRRSKGGSWFGPRLEIRGPHVSKKVCFAKTHRRFCGRAYVRTDLVLVNPRGTGAQLETGNARFHTAPFGF